MLAAALMANAFLGAVSLIAEGGALYREAQAETLDALGGIVGGFEDVINGIASGFADLFMLLLPMAGPLAGALLETVDSLRAGVVDSGAPEELRGLADEARAGADELRAGAAVARGMMIDTGAISLAIRNLIDQDLDTSRQRAQDLIDQKKLQDDVNESLLNIPQGFKVSLARFRAIETGDDVGGRSVDIGGDTSTTGTINQPITIEELIIQTDDVESLFDQLGEEVQRRAQQGNGNPFGQNEFNRNGA
jgi:hypothetical protein